MFYIKLWDVVRTSYSMIRIIFRNNVKLKRLSGNFSLLILKKCEVCGTNVFAEVIPNLIPGKAFPKKYLKWLLLLQGRHYIELTRF